MFGLVRKKALIRYMKEIKDENRASNIYAKYPPKDNKQEKLNCYSQGYEDGTDNFYNVMVDIIRKHMNDVPEKEDAEICLSKEDFEFLRNHESMTFRCGNEYVTLHKGRSDGEKEMQRDNDSWIPVEERLPERTPDEKIKNSYKKYLVFIDNIDYWDIDIAVYDLWNDKKWRKFSNTYCEIENVTAWCSLPDPYKKI